MSSQTVKFSVAPDFGDAPHQVAWASGKWSARGAEAAGEFAPGRHRVQVVVVDAKGRRAETQVTITIPGTPDPAGGIAKKRDGGNPGFVFRGPGPYTCKLAIRPREAA